MFEELQRDSRARSMKSEEKVSSSCFEASALELTFLVPSQLCLPSNERGNRSVRQRRSAGKEEERELERSVNLRRGPNLASRVLQRDIKDSLKPLKGATGLWKVVKGFERSRFELKWITR